jgi:hypothetical protein
MSDHVPPEHPAWRDYRRRRVACYVGLVVILAVLAALHRVDLGEALMFCAYVVAGLLLLVGSLWLGSFPCPSCGEYWFDYRDETDAPAWAAWRQETCARCGFHRYAQPRTRPSRRR